MFNNSSKIMFLMILISGTMITISSSSWLGAWMGLEINLMSFIPLMNDTNNLMSTEASLKYFLTQTLASITLLFSIILSMMKYNLLFTLNFDSNFLNIMIMSSLIMKTGMAPFHFWFPEVIEGITWINALILMTWQKLAPFILLSYFNFNSFMYFPIMLSAFIGAIGGFNQTSLKKIMAFSSINHMSWMLLALSMNEMLWMTYFLLYCIMSSSLILLFYLFQVFHLNQLHSMFFPSKMLKFSLFLNFLSLGGLPPFLGFYPKWLIINFLTINQQFFSLFFMVMMSLITLFFYLRMCYTIFMLNFYKTNWINQLYMNNSTNYLYMAFSFISSFGLIIMPSLFIY